MSWDEIPLGDAIRLKRGHDLPNSRRISGEIPIVSSSGITGYHNVAKATGPGVVTGRYGTLGEVHYIEGDYWPLNTALYVEDFKGNHPRFIAYLLMTLELGAQNAAGAVPGINRNTLHQMPIRLPKPETQKLISDILATYDDLIAANQRRVQLLEESARLLYREWFVMLRFPGHETMPVTDGVPEGWKRRTLGNYVTLNYGKSLKATDRVDGDFPVYGSSGIVGNNIKPLITGPAIIVGRKGNVGSLFYSHCPCFPIDTVYFISSEQTSYYLFLALQGFNFISSDAAVPGLNRNYAYSQQLLIPSPEVFTTFEAKIRPVFEQMNALTDWNNKLRQARDMLLPKLMSGALDVSRIVVPTEVEV